MVNDAIKAVGFDKTDRRRVSLATQNKRLAGEQKYFLRRS